MKLTVDLKEESAETTPSSDAEIAAAAMEAIQWLTTIPAETIKVKAQNGWVNVEGTVEWWHQRDTLGDIIRHVPGVKGLSNFLTIRSEFDQATTA